MNHHKFKLLILILLQMTSLEVMPNEPLLAQCENAIETQIGSESQYAKEIYVIEHKSRCQVGIKFESSENLVAFGQVRVKSGRSPDHLATTIGNPIKLKFELIKTE